MADLTDEQREAARAILREQIAALLAVARTGTASDVAFKATAVIWNTIDALIAQGWGPVADAEVRTRAEKEIAENGDAIAAARAEYGQDDKTSVPGILAMLRREVLRKAGCNAAEEDWIGAIECLAQADAYAYAEREIRERSLGGPVAEAEARSQSPYVRDANQRLISLVAWLEADPGNPELLVSQFGQNERAAIIRALTPKKPEEAEAEDRGYRAGVEDAAKVLKRRWEYYVEKNGIYDPTTNVIDYPEDGDKWVREWQELEYAIQRLVPKKSKKEEVAEMAPLTEQSAPSETPAKEKPHG